MDRLSALDASFLRVETPTAHMHVGWVSVVDRPAGAARLEAAAPEGRVAPRLPLGPRFRPRVVTPPLGAAAAARLPLVPLFRRRVGPLPLGGTEPVWRDDPSFDLGRHIRTAPDDRELDSRDLQRLADDFLSVPLDREKPLWEILVVPRMV